MTQDTDAQAELEAVFDWLRELVDQQPEMTRAIVKLLRSIANMIATW